MNTYYIHNFHNSYGDFTINNYKFTKFKKAIPKSFGDLITHKCVIKKQKEKHSALYDKKTELDDICLLLSFFLDMIFILLTLQIDAHIPIADISHLIQSRIA